MPPPIIVGPLLSDPTHFSFGDFLILPETRALFGLNTDGAKLLSKLVKERDFLLLRASKHRRTKTGGASCSVDTSVALIWAILVVCCTGGASAR